MFMDEINPDLKNILNILDKEGMLKDVIIIGSWSLFFYKKIFLDFEPLIRTSDIDFYIPNAKLVKEKNNVISSLKEINFDLVKDTLTNKTKFISPDGFEIEFLTRLNKEGLSCVKIGNTGLFAESLSYVDIFTGNFVEVDFDGLIVRVASPSSYVLQKLIINSKRVMKSEKDLESIEYVLNFIKMSPKSHFELLTLYNSLPKSWQKKINQISRNNNINLF